MDYNEYHAKVANEYLNTKDKRVLVVGCNRGKDVSYFLEFGASEVWGIDVMDEVGKEYPHERARYFQMSAEQINIPSNTFDLVYCFATMEHIPNIEQAFSEMVRVAKTEGIIYCVAAPLWNSRQGHHRSDVFNIEGYPWVHIRFSAEEIKSKCRTGEISYPDWVADIDGVVDYMMDKRYFNLRSAQDYLDSCNALEPIHIIRNDLDFEEEYYLSLLPVDEFKRILEKGIKSKELLALTHTFVARKISSEHDCIDTDFNIDVASNIGTDFNLEKDADSNLEELERVKAQSQMLQSRIEAMESSKFWKLRSLWMKLKRKLGLSTND